MDEFEQRLGSLSPGQRRLFEQRLTQRSLAAQPASTIPRRGSAEPAALSFGQRRQWFLQQLEPGNPVYQKAEILRLRGPLARPAFQQALDALVARHEILRTHYLPADPEPLQVVGEAVPVDLPLVDLTGLPSGEQEERARRWAAEAVGRPFDLARDPMFRTTLFRLGLEEHLWARVSHHIAFDKWSVGIFYRDFSELYAAQLDGRQPALPKLPIQYADFAIWQREAAGGSRGAAPAWQEHLAYWKKQLSGAPAALPLPLDHPRPAVQTHHGGTCRLTLPPELAGTLKTFSQAQGATLFMTLLAAFQVLLHRYSGQADLLVGVPVAGRSRAESEDLIGLFINTLVLRADLSDNPPFREYLARVRRFALEAYAHQDLPFERLVEELQPERSLGRTPLFQVMFDFLNTPTHPLVLPGLEITRLESGDEDSIYDLSLLVNEAGGGLQAIFEYNRDLFAPATIERMTAHFQNLLGALLRDPETCVGDLQMLSDAERRRLLIEWNATQVEVPHPACLHQFLERQAARTPEAIALAWDGGQMTYAELEARAGRIAGALHGMGAGPGTIVGLGAGRSPQQVAALLGILKAGGAYLPLDPTYPAERLAFMLADSGAPVVLAGRDWTLTRPQGSVQILDIEAVWEKADASLVTSQLDPDQPVYVLYTSGSTGQPKGVVVGHRSAVNFVHFARRFYQIQPQDRVMQFASLNFDTAVEELFPALAAGARVVLRPEPLFGTFAEFERWVEGHGITVLDLPTAYWHVWVQELARRGSPLPTAVRLVIVGGEKALPEDYAVWRRLYGRHPRWVNTYGPTEATVVSLVYEPRDDWQAGAALPIGRPIDNVQAYILDPYGNPAPPGVPGELYLGGGCLALGYLNRPELTAERFVELHVANDDLHIVDLQTEAGNSQLAIHNSYHGYRTGDLARFLPDGNIEYLGRADQQVKIRGYRIEPGEIEAVLRRHPAVQDAAVVVRQVGPSELQLAAYWVSRGSPADRAQPAGPGELRAFLKDRLPEYMVPAVFEAVEALPLTANGKLDRHGLAARPLPSAAGQSREVPAVLPKTALEQMLAGIFAETLGLSAVEAGDNFFDLGGHSLLTLRLLSRIVDLLQVDPPLRSVFETPTVAGLAAALGSSEAERQRLERVAGLVLRLARLSEEEAEQMLNGRQPRVPVGSGPAAGQPEAGR